MKLKALIAIFFSLLLFTACKENAQKENKAPKYIFYFIGDGYGPAQAHMAEIFLADQKESGRIYPDTLLMNTFPVHGTYTTFAHNRVITGSAAAGTALAAGHKTTINTVCMSEDHAKSYQSLAEKFQERGKKIGIVTSVSIDHATPAVFYAHQPSRHMYYNIALELPKSGFNYFAGGGFKDPYGKNKDNTGDVRSNMGIGSNNTTAITQDSIPSAYQVAKANGYRFVKSRKDFNALKLGDDKVILFSQRPAGGQSMPFVIDQNDTDFTLVDFTRKGIELLDNPEGFFMMIEGGKIDWACHANDAASTALEVLQFDQAVEEAYKFYLQHPDETLIVICSDHETGGLTLGWAGSKYESAYRLLSQQKASIEIFSLVMEDFKRQHKSCKYQDLYPLLKEYYGFDSSEDMQLTDYEIKELKQALQDDCNSSYDQRRLDMAKECAYGPYNPVAIVASRILAHKAGIGWTTYSHTALPCPARAIGVGAECFYGAYDNTDLPKKVLKACQITE